MYFAELIVCTGWMGSLASRQEKGIWKKDTVRASQAKTTLSRSEGESSHSLITRWAINCASPLTSIRLSVITVEYERAPAELTVFRRTEQLTLNTRNNPSLWHKYNILKLHRWSALYSTVTAGITNLFPCIKSTTSSVTHHVLATPNFALSTGPSKDIYCPTVRLTAWLIHHALVHSPIRSRKWLHLV